MDRSRLVSGDHLGRLALWSVEEVVEEVVEGVVEVRGGGMPARRLEVVGEERGHSHLSGLALTRKGMVTTSWGGKVTAWTFRGRGEVGREEEGGE